MPPSARPSLAPFLTLLVFFSLNLLHHVPRLIWPPHEDSLVRTLTISNSTFRVTTLRNRLGNRCALFRCTSPAYGDTATSAAAAAAHNDDPTCDLVYVEMTTPAVGAPPGGGPPRNLSTRMCPALYFHSQWDALASMYNNGFVYLSPGVTLVHRVSALVPHDPRAVHLSVARNNIDLSTAWLAAWPSNATRAVFAAWARAAWQLPLPPPAQPPPPLPEQDALNRVRGCRGPDIACHPRHAAVAWQCDGAHHPRACAAPPYYVDAARAMLVALTAVAAAGMLLTAVGRAAPRLRALAAALSFSSPYAYSSSTAPFGRPLAASGASALAGQAAALAALCVVALAGEDWPTIVHIIARLCSVTFRQRVEAGHLWSGDVFRAVPDLRGMYEGYSYIFRDGTYMVRVSGPGVSLVVSLTSALFFVKRVLLGGLLVKCAFWLLVVKGASALISQVASHGRKEVSDEDEYYRRRSEFVAAGFSKQRKSRSFLMPRETNMQELMGGIS